MRVAAFFCFWAAVSASAGAQELSQAIGLYRHGQFDRAAEMLRKRPPSADLQLWLGKSYLKLRRWDDAIRELEEAAKAQPSNSMVHLWLGRAYGHKASHVTFFRAPGWARKALREFEAAVKLDPRNLDARFDLLEFYLEAPGFLGGGRDKAEAEAGQIAAVNPRYGCSARARLLQQEKNWDQARKELTRATVEFPKDPGAFTDLAEFLLARGDYAAAAANAREALRLDEDDATARFLISAAEIALRRNIADAGKTLASLSAGPLDDSDPEFQQVFYWLGRAFQEEGKPAEAREAYRSALRYDPEHEAARKALSRIRT